MKILLMGAAITASVLCGTSARADTVSGGSLYTSYPTDYSKQLGYLALFNPNAGTLTGVTLTVGYGFSSLITISAPSASTGSARTESAASFTSSDATMNFVFRYYVNHLSNTTIGATSLNAAYDLVGGASSFSLAAGQSASFESHASRSTSNSIAKPDLRLFYASADRTLFDVSGSAISGLLLSASGGNPTAWQITTANQSISIDYTYTPNAVLTPSVPEPATWAMMTLGFGAMGFAMRRRKVETRIRFA